MQSRNLFLAAFLLLIPVFGYLLYQHFYPSDKYKDSKEAALGVITPQKKKDDPWVPNPYVAKFDEQKREGRGPIPIDGFELFEHGDNKGDRLDFVENEQLIKGSGVNGANWSGVLDLWSPEGMKTWSWPGGDITKLQDDPFANHNNTESNGKVKHGYRFQHPVIQGLFDLVMDENVIFKSFSPVTPRVNLQAFKATRTGVEKDEDEEDMEKFIHDSLIG